MVTSVLANILVRANLRLREISLLSVVTGWRDAESVKPGASRPATFASHYTFLYWFFRSIGKDPDTAILWAHESPDRWIQVTKPFCGSYLSLHFAHVTSYNPM